MRGRWLEELLTSEQIDHQGLDKKELTIEFETSDEGWPVAVRYELGIRSIEQKAIFRLTFQGIQLVRCKQSPSRRVAKFSN